MKDQADYSLYKCPYEHVDKERGHELHSPEGYEKVYGVWCACGYRGPVFCLDPDELNLQLKTLSPPPDSDLVEQIRSLALNFADDTFIEKFPSDYTSLLNGIATLCHDHYQREFVVRAALVIIATVPDELVESTVQALVDEFN